MNFLKKFFAGNNNINKEQKLNDEDINIDNIEEIEQLKSNDENKNTDDIEEIKQIKLNDEEIKIRNIEKIEQIKLLIRHIFYNELSNIILDYLNFEIMGISLKIMSFEKNILILDITSNQKEIFLLCKNNCSFVSYVQCFDIFNLTLSRTFDLCTGVNIYPSKFVASKKNDVIYLMEINSKIITLINTNGYFIGRIGSEYVLNQKYSMYPNYIGLCDDESEIYTFQECLDDRCHFISVCSTLNNAIRDMPITENDYLKTHNIIIDENKLYTINFNKDVIYVYDTTNGKKLFSFSFNEENKLKHMCKHNKKIYVIDRNTICVCDMKGNEIKTWETTIFQNELNLICSVNDFLIVIDDNNNMYKYC